MPPTLVAPREGPVLQGEACGLALACITLQLLPWTLGHTVNDDPQIPSAKQSRTVNGLQGLAMWVQK